MNPIETLLGISGDSREWRYLNKGTHEEADRAEVHQAIEQEALADRWLDQVHLLEVV